MLGLNVWAILVSALVSFVVGMVWYSKPCFGDAWIKAAGLPKDKVARLKKRMVLSSLMGFVNTLVMMAILALVVKYFFATSFILGVLVGFLVWLGFISTTMFGMILWEGKPTQLYMINACYYLASLLIAGGILAVWR